MSSINEDLNQIGRLFSDIKYCRMSSRNDYNVIYYSSNENLNGIFSNYELKNKSCLTSIGSGDQAFHLINRGAKEVDVFDINKLAIYYYYLRRWCIEYLNKFYPNNRVTNELIIDLVMCVKPRSENEERALLFWKQYICRYCDFVSRDIICRCDKYRVNKISDLDTLRKRMSDNFNYYNIDISKDVSGIKKTYDYIFKSNISEYVSHDEDSLIKYRDNLYNLLNKNGKVISTFLMTRNIPYNEFEIFSEKFDVCGLPKVKSGRHYDSPGYTLIKK